MYVPWGLTLAGLEWNYADMCGIAFAGLEWSYADMHVPGRLTLAGCAWSYADMYVLDGPAWAGYAWSCADMYVPSRPDLNWGGHGGSRADMHVPSRPAWNCRVLKGAVQMYVRARFGRLCMYAPGRLALAVQCRYEICMYAAGPPWWALHRPMQTCTWRARLGGP